MRVVIAVLLVWCVVSTLYAINQHVQVVKLQHKVQFWINETWTWRKRCEILVKNNQKLLTEIDDLKEQIKWMNFSMQRLKKLEEENEKLRYENMELKGSLMALQQKLRLYEQVPHGYYSVNMPKYPNTLEGLKAFLKNFKLPHKYVRNVFDCSEIAAYTEWKLENSGFDARIVLGMCSGEQHAWVSVSTLDGTFYLEPQTKRIYKPSEYPCKVIETFKNIYEAVSYYGNIKEWDWWNVVGFKAS